jgi:hypothetical protein
VGSYGFGTFIDQFPELVVAWHDGGVPGWVGHVSWVRSEGFAVALLGNSWPSGFNALAATAECIYGSVLGVELPDMSEPSDPSTWSPCTGTYDIVDDEGNELQATVNLGDSGLSVTFPDSETPGQTVTAPMDNLHGLAFRFWDSPTSWRIVTFIHGQGTPPAIRWARNDRFAGQRLNDLRRATGRLEP